MPTFNYTTGPTSLPDIGQLQYNGCQFGPLFESNVNSVFVKDDAGRTVKWVEYTLTVDGYVTKPAGELNTEETLDTLMRLLSAQGGSLLYSGKGVRIAVNGAGGPEKDVAWGPVPEILDIQPLGNGGSAKIKWTVKVRVAPPTTKERSDDWPILQFNYDTSVSYDETGYSSLSIKGVLEIALTRQRQNDRRVLQTADDYRIAYVDPLLASIDKTRFRITDRQINVSRDKRVLTFSVTAEEMPWMIMPPNMMSVRGSFSFKPVKAGMGLANWLCTLTCTYTLGKTQPRREAWFAFLALLQARMRNGSTYGRGGDTGQNPGPTFDPGVGFAANLGYQSGAAVRDLYRQLFGGTPAPPAGAASTRRVFLIDFGGTEGLYLDSKTMTFTATWRLVTVFSEILLASGLWKRVPGLNENMWATSVERFMGSESWLANRVDPTFDAIVDFGEP